MKILRPLGRWTAKAATAFLAGGLSVRLTVGDTLPGLSALYYATPWSVLAASAIFPALLWARRRQWLAVAGFALVSLCCAVAWVRDAFRPVTPAGKSSLRVAYWNVGRPESTLGDVLNVVGDIHADVFGFGETKKMRGDIPPRPEWLERQPDKQILPLRRHMLLASPTKAVQLHDGFLNDRGQYALTQTELHGRKVLILMADFDAIIAWSRKPAFDRLIEIIDSIGDEPLIVMGDFNTPSDSAFFAPMRSRLKDVFETAGRGYAKTWPMPLPVLDLDHIWVSHHFRVVNGEHRTTFLSDHRPVIADLEF